MKLYQKIESLCIAKGINVTEMCKELGIGRASMTELKMERTASLSTKNLTKIAGYFNVSIEYLVNETETPSDAKGTEERDKNIVRVIGRDGTYTERTLTDDQLRALQMIIDQMPDAPDDL